MARALLVAALGAPLLAWSWMSLESGHDAGQATLVVVLAIAAALVRPRWARVAACLAALLVAGAIAFGVGHVWALPARMLSRFGNGFLEFYDYQVPFDPATHPRMHGVLLLALFAFTLAFALAVAARRPALAAMALVVGVGWPGTLLPGHDLLRGTMLLVAVLGTVVLLRHGPVRGLGAALVAGTLIVLAALAATSSPAFAKRAFLNWQHWDLYTKPAKPVDVSYVWNSRLRRPHLPRQADDRHAREGRAAGALLARLGAEHGPERDLVRGGLARVRRPAGAARPARPRSAARAARQAAGRRST